MQYYLITIFDKKVGAYGAVGTARSINEAIRSFMDEVNSNKQSNMLTLHPEDFELYTLGTYDDQIGQIIAYDKPQIIFQGTNARNTQ